MCKVKLNQEQRKIHERGYVLCSACAAADQNGGVCLSDGHISFRRTCLCRAVRSWAPFSFTFISPDSTRSATVWRSPAFRIISSLKKKIGLDIQKKVDANTISTTDFAFDAGEEQVNRVTFHYASLSMNPCAAKEDGRPAGLRTCCYSVQKCFSVKTLNKHQFLQLTNSQKCCYALRGLELYVLIDIVYKLIV